MISSMVLTIAADSKAINEIDEISVVDLDPEKSAMPKLAEGVYVYGFRSKSPYSPIHQIPTTRRPR